MSDESKEIRCHLGITHPVNNQEVQRSFAAQGISGGLVRVVGSLESPATADELTTYLEPSASSGQLWILKCKNVSSPTNNATLTVRGYNAQGENKATGHVTFKLVALDRKPKRIDGEITINHPAPGAKVPVNFAAYGTYNASSLRTPSLNAQVVCDNCGAGSSPVGSFSHLNPEGESGFWIAAFKGLTADKQYTLSIEYGDASAHVEFTT